MSNCRKYLLAIFILGIAFHTGHAQISNGGFEGNLEYPTSLGQWFFIHDWSNAGGAGTPDYYHYNGSGAADLPKTPIGSIDAYEGNAIVGLSLCGTPGEHYREYLSTQLETNLVKGGVYELSFAMSNGHVSATAKAGLSVDKIGFCFTELPLVQTAEEPIFSEPQIEISQPFYSPDWHLLKYRFTASAAHGFLTIGVFRDDDELKIIDVAGAGAQRAYYFFDAFSLTKLDITMPNDWVQNDLKNLLDVYKPIDAETQESLPVREVQKDLVFMANSFSPNGDGTNDVFNASVSEGLNYVLTIYNRWGIEVYKGDAFSAGWDGRFGGALAQPDIYIWHIQLQHTDSNGSISESVQKGTLMLLR